MSTAILELVERIRAGDREALERLLHDELPGLRAYVRLRAGAALRERESVSDLVQSTCREVLGNLEVFEHGGAAGFRRWLYAAALRKIVNRAEHWGALKRDARRAEPLAGGAPGEAQDRELAAIYCSLGTPSQQAVARETLEALERAFDRLSADRREIIVLARIVGLDHAALAQHFGCSEVAARQRLFRALAELGEWLGPGQAALPAPGGSG